MRFSFSYMQTIRIQTWKRTTFQQKACAIKNVKHFTVKKETILLSVQSLFVRTWHCTDEASKQTVNNPPHYRSAIPKDLLRDIFVLCNLFFLLSLFVV